MTTQTLPTVTHAALVYQAGIANVFDCTLTRDRSRIYQGDFRTAEMICYGLGRAGCFVRTYACNQAGDILSASWDTPLSDAPFSDKFHPQTWNGA
jgi:hypothetical protein